MCMGKAKSIFSNRCSLTTLRLVCRRNNKIFNQLFADKTFCSKFEMPVFERGQLSRKKSKGQNLLSVDDSTRRLDRKIIKGLDLGK